MDEFELRRQLTDNETSITWIEEIEMQFRYRNAVSYLTIFGTCLLSLRCIHAENLVQNGDFDLDISGWTSTGTCFPPTYDTFGPGFSDGAMTVNCFSPSGPKTETVTQCIGMSHHDFDFSAQVSNNGIPAPVVFNLTAYPTADCSGTGTTLLGINVTPDASCCGVSWATASQAAVQLSPATQSLLVGIMVATPASIAVDKVRLIPETVFSDGFEPAP